MFGHCLTGAKCTLPSRERASVRDKAHGVRTHDGSRSSSECG